MRTKRRRRQRVARQTEMKLTFGRGGPGRSLGRPKRVHGYVPHTRRPFIESRHPVHVSTSVIAGLPSLRGRRLWAVVRGAFVRGCKRGRFRIAHFSVQGRHVHLLCEAKDRQALSRGIQGFKISVAKRINRALGKRTGTVFADRYHERIVTNPTQCRHALAYVLNNGRHHGYEQRVAYRRDCVDPCSSAAYFDGWAIDAPRPWNARPADDDEAPPVARAKTWLLRVGWRRGGGPISPNHIPAMPKGAPPLPQW